MPLPDIIRVLLVDDHSVVRMGLAAVLSVAPDLEVVGEAEDGAQAIAAYRSNPPDVVVMDIRMPGIDGITALAALRTEWPDAKVLLLTTSELDNDLHRGFDAGACGYVSKTVSRDELVRAIRIVHSGHRYLSSGMEERLAQLAKLKQLSGREVEVLDGMRRGLSNRDVAQALGISENTVKVHVKAILLKLESADRAEAVARGFERGLLRVEGT